MLYGGKLKELKAPKISAKKNKKNLFLVNFINFIFY